MFIDPSKLLSEGWANASLFYPRAPRHLSRHEFFEVSHCRLQTYFLSHGSSSVKCTCRVCLVGRGPLLKFLTGLETGSHVNMNQTEIIAAEAEVGGS